MIADAPVGIANHAVENAAHVDEVDLEPALLADFAAHRFPGRLTELDEAARDAPLPRQGDAAALDEQHAVAVEDHGADADARIVGILATHGRPDNHASVAYFSRTSAPTSVASDPVRPL